MCLCVFLPAGISPEPYARFLPIFVGYVLLLAVDRSSSSVVAIGPTLCTSDFVDFFLQWAV